MNSPTTQPGASRIWKALAIALLLAAVVLVTIVLPAEFGYDPTRVGRALGLTEMHQDYEEDAPSGIAGTSDVLPAPADAANGDPLPLANPAISQIEDAAPRTETITVRLGFDERTEVKAVLARNKVITYSWQVEGGNVYVDFHGHDPARGQDFWVRYDEADQITGRSGSLVAPFDGEHGWYWLNTSDEPITIQLTVSGYFERLVDYGVFDSLGVPAEPSQAP